MAWRTTIPPTELIIASASAVALPGLLGGLTAQIPGGPIGQIAVGVGAVVLATKLEGPMKAVVVGAGIGVAVTGILRMVAQRKESATV